MESGDDRAVGVEHRRSNRVDVLSELLVHPYVTDAPNVGQPVPQRLTIGHGECCLLCQVALEIRLGEFVGKVSQDDKTRGNGVKGCALAGPVPDCHVLFGVRGVIEVVDGAACEIEC